MKKRSGTKLVVRGAPSSTELDSYKAFPLEPNVWAQRYLDSLSSSASVPAQRSGLRAAARIMSGDHPEVTIANFPWHLLRVDHMRMLKSALTRKEYGPRTINRMLAAVKGVLRMAWEGNAMSTDHYTRAISVRGESVANLEPAGRHVPQYEIATLLRTVRASSRASRDRDLAMIVFMYGAGLRRQEVSALDTENYRDKDGGVRVVKGKRGKFRTTYLPKGMHRFVKPWVDKQRERGAEPMFCRWHRGGPGPHRLSVLGVDRVLGVHVKECGIKAVTPHDLRRSFATELLDNDADILMVQDLMGHASVATTKIYDRRAEKGKKKAIELFPMFDWGDE